MAVKTFTTGEVLTAADTNTYLNNGGLVYITQATISSQANYTFSNVFSATYDNYRIIISGGIGAVGGIAIVFRLGTTATGYYGTRYYDLYTGAETGALRSNNDVWAGVTNLSAANDEATATFDLLHPFDAKRTSWAGNWYGNGYSGWVAGTLANTTSYTNFYLASNTGNNFSANVRIYGYREG